MKSVGLALKLRPGCYDEYKKRHDELWPDLAEAMKKRGISMVIYRHEETLFVYGTGPSQKEWDELGADPVTPRWNKYMSEVLQTDARGALIFISLPQAFKFGSLE